MKKHFWVPAVALALGGLLFVGCSGSQSSPTNPAAMRRTVQGSSSGAPEQDARGVPPFHKTVEAAKPFPPLLPAAFFREYPLAGRAYKAASEIPEVIAQQPCYCFCEKFGHRSLLDCYASDHGAG
jgi:hypothetical protein